MNIGPVFQLVLHPTYYKMGFFNIPREFDRYVRPDQGVATIALRNKSQKLEVYVNRTANRNGTARIMGGTALRQWFQSQYDESDVVPVVFVSPTKMEIGE